MQETRDVVVVGAGLAGLNAARHLTRAGASVLVLEAREEVGGRTLSVRKDGRRFELGGEWTGRGHRRLLGLATELGLEVESAGQLGAPVLWRMPRRETVSRLPPTSTLRDLARGLWSAARLSRSLDPEAPWTSPSAVELDSLSLADWLEEREIGEDARWLVADLVGALTSSPIERVSLLQVLWWMARGGGPIAGLRTTFQSRIRQGTQEIARHIARGSAGSVLTGSPVVSVRQSRGSVVVGTEPGDAHPARRVVVAVPAPQLSGIGFDPPLPPELIVLGDLRIDPGTKVAAALPPGRLPRHRAVIGKRTLWGAWRSDDQVTGFAAPPESELADAELIADLGAAFETDPAQLRSVSVQRWSDEDWIPGCDVAFAPGELTRHGPQLRARHGLVSFAGPSARAGPTTWKELWRAASGPPARL